jgi:ssDNA-binding Zn-finger/Zn-ribbon topoisomerase 1
MNDDYSFDDFTWVTCAKCGGPRLLREDSPNCALCDMQDSIDKEEAIQLKNKDSDPICPKCGDEMWVLDADLVGYRDYLDCWCNTCKEIFKGEKSEEEE